MASKRRLLGAPLPVLDEISAPTPEQIDRDVARWDQVMHEWAGFLDQKPPGTPGARFWYDEVKRVTINAKTGKVVTMKQKQALMIEFQRKLKK